MAHYNPYASGYGRSATGYPIARGQTRGNYGYMGRGAQSGWLNYQCQAGNFNQAESYPYSNTTYEEHQATIFAHCFNSTNSQQHQMGAGGPQGCWGTLRPAYNNFASHGQHQQRGIGGHPGSRRTPIPGLNNMGYLGQHQRDTGGPQGSYSAPRSCLNDMGSCGQNQRGTGGPQGSSSTSRGQNQRGTGGPQGSSSTSRGQNQRGTGGPQGSSSTSRGQNQRGTGGPQGSSSTSRGQNQRGTKGPRGSSSTSRGQNQRGTKGPQGSSSTSRGQNQRGTGGPQGSSTSRGQNQRGTGGPQGSYRTSRGQNQRGTEGHWGSSSTSRGQNQRGTGDQHQRDTGGSQGSRRTSRSAFNNSDQSGNQNQDAGSGTVPKAQQGKEISKKYLDFSFLVQPDVVCLMKEFKVMFILRGLSGSGKSTVAEALLQKYGEDAVICSADDYRYNEQGEYVWSKETLQETHTKSQERADKFCKENKPVVIIDNTNVTYANMKPYFQTAKNYGYIAVLAEPKTPWKLNPRELAKRNKHNVSFTSLSRKCNQYEDQLISPLYFAWFLSLGKSSYLRQCAKDILQDCLEIDDYKQYIAYLSGKNASDCTVQDVTSLYLMTKTNDHQRLHVTACFAPREKNLGGSPYVKNKQVQDSLGQISWITIVGWVITPNTFSARVALPKLQRKLWTMEDKQRRVITPRTALENLKLDEKKTSVELEVANESRKQYCSPTIASHITLGSATDVDPVQAKYDNRRIIEHELSKYPYAQEYVLANGTARKYDGNLWVIYLDDAIKVPGLFSGCYE